MWCLGWGDRPGRDGRPKPRPTSVIGRRIKAGDLVRRAHQLAEDQQRNPPPPRGGGGSGGGGGGGSGQEGFLLPMKAPRGGGGNAGAAISKSVDLF